MRVLVAQKRFHPNSYGIVRGLLERGHAVTLITHKGLQSEEVGSVPLPPTIVSYYSLFERVLSGKNVHRFAIPNLRHLWRVLKTSDADVVLIKNARMPALITGLLARCMGATIVQFTNTPPDSRSSPRYTDRIKSLLLPRLNIHTTGGGAVGGDVPIRGGAACSRFLPYPVVAFGPPKSPGNRQNSRNKVAILSVGAFTNERKRPEWVIEALAREGLLGVASVTFIGGGGPESPGIERIRAAEKRHGVAPSTIRCRVPYREVQESYRDYDLFVLPARDEPFGAVIPEAMIHGLPVVCSDSCGARGCFEDGVSGLVFGTESVDDLGRKLRVLVTEPDKRTAMGAAAHARAEAVLTPAGWVAAFESMIADSDGGVAVSADADMGP